MDSNCNVVENNNSHEVYIKKEPFCQDDSTVAVKFEEPSVYYSSQNEMVCASSDGATVTNAHLYDSEMHFKIEIKEEPHWFETSSTETNCKSENYCHSDIDLQNKSKENASHMDEIAAAEVSMLHRGLMCRNRNSGSYSTNNTNSEENSWGKNNPNVAKASQLLNSNQSQMLEELETNYILGLDAKNYSLIQNYKMPHNSENCGKSFRLLLDLKGQHHMDKKQVKSESSGNSSELNLEGHKLNHEEKKIHTCEICKKSFTQAFNLKQHKLTHEGKRPHTCEICSKSFTVASNLKQHNLTHEGKRPYKCEICNKSFIQASNMKRHVLSHEGKRPYTCEICKKSFIQPSHLKRHILTHEGERQHICEICYKSFTQASSLKRHKLIHEGKRQ